MRQAQLLGHEAINAELDEQLMSLIGIVAEVCMKEEYERCQADHIFHCILPMYLGWERQLQLGLAGAPSVQETLPRIRKYVEQCLRFEVVFGSTVVSGKPNEDNFETHVEASYDAVQAVEGICWPAPLVNEAFEYTAMDKDCMVTANRGGGTFKSPQLSFLVEQATPNDQISRVSKLFLNYFPRDTSEEFGYQCPDYRLPTIKSPLWTGMFIAAHQGDASAEGGFMAADWEIFGNEYYAKKEWQIDKPNED